MSGARDEELVAAFLDRRAREPDLDPAVFAAEHPDAGPGLAGALRRALELEALLEGDDAAPERPERIGPWRVLRELGRGGMGVVYAVERDGEACALKLLPQAGLLAPKALERFRREAAILARLEHPGIVRVRDVGSWHGSPWYAMDRVEGRPLGGPAARDPREAARVVRDLAVAVAAAHDARVLHRDLKPQNVILTPDGRPVLIDFGLTAAGEEASLTSTGERLGTPRYMAPEAAAGRAADERTDVWGLGQILYELLVGRPAFDQPTRAAALAAIAVARFPAPRRLRPDVPAALDAIALTALARRPARRYASARAMADDLDRFLAGRATVARAPGPLRRAAEALRARPRAALAGGAVAAAVLAVAAVALEGRRAAAAARAATYRVELDRALVGWADGDEGAARRALAAALAADADAPAARALRAHLDAEPPSADGDVARVRAALAALDGGEPGEAAELLAELGPAFGPLEGRALRLAGRADDARARLERAREAEPDRAALALELARAWVDLGRDDRAAAVLERALAHAADDARLWERLADVRLRGGDARAGLAAAARAAELLVARGQASPTYLARLVERAPDAAALRDELAAFVAEHPERTDVRFALASSLDSAHAVADARRAYRAVLERDPDHVHAHLNLGWLACGANREHCESCRAAFEEHPELVDRSAAVRHLSRALELDRGRDEAVLRNVEKIATDKGLVPEVAAVLEELARDRERTAAVARIEDALRRMRRAVGEPP